MKHMYIRYRRQRIPSFPEEITRRIHIQDQDAKVIATSETVKKARAF